jgi:hypothetical protein
MVDNSTVDPWIGKTAALDLVHERTGIRVDLDKMEDVRSRPHPIRSSDWVQYHREDILELQEADVVDYETKYVRRYGATALANHLSDHYSVPGLDTNFTAKGVKELISRGFVKQDGEYKGYPVYNLDDSIDDRTLADFYEELDN